MLIGDNKSYPRQYTVNSLILRFLSIFFLCFIGVVSYFVFDYIELSNERSNYRNVISEYRHLRGETKVLMANLKEAKEGLTRVEDYALQIDELVSLKVDKITQKTGVKTPDRNNHGNLTEQKLENATKLPLGISIDSLSFKPVLRKIETVNLQATKQAFNLQSLLSTLEKKSFILSSVPMSKPVKGWYASGFGYRTSPFTGKRALHRGLDIAAPVGTPIYAPADGVIIFSGNKSGFGKFIMIAHGNGIVTRYGHNAQLLVKPGDKVQRGDKIATVGLTGRTTGPHLHYEVWVNGKPANPSNFIINTAIAIK